LPINTANMTIKNNINENNNSEKPTYCPLKIE